MQVVRQDEFSDPIPKDQVIRTDPPAGTEIESSSSGGLRVCSPAPAMARKRPSVTSHVGRHLNVLAGASTATAQPDLLG